MPTRNVNLSDKQAKFIRGRVERGGYRNASEVVRAGLRLLERAEREEKLKLAALRRLAKGAFGGIDRGEFEMIDPQEVDQFMEKLGRRARGSKS